MIKTLLCLGLLAAVEVQGLSRHTRMVGGDIVSDSSFSYQVGIRPRRTQAGVTINLPPCTGVLISGVANTAITGSTPNYILTSATCALSGTTLDIYAGVTKIDVSVTPKESIESANAIIHPDYFRGLNQGDLAILPATAALAPDQISLTAAKLINIDNAGKSYLFNRVSMAGWGYPNDVFHLQSPSLRSLNAYVAANFYCSLVHFGKPITNKHICTGGLINKGPCTGDSGAPLVNGDRVIGLATLTPQDGCSKGKPGVFTHLGHYLAWIVQMTGYNPEQ